MNDSSENTQTADKEDDDTGNSNTLIDLLLDGQFRHCLCRYLDPQATLASKITNKSDFKLNRTAITYIDSDWNISSLLYCDLVKYCHLFFDEFSKLISPNFPLIPDVDDDEKSQNKWIKPILIIYGDCAQWTPVFMIAANLAGFAFYSADKQDQLNEAFNQLGRYAIFKVFVCHKYRFNELSHLLQIVGQISKKEIVNDYYLIYYSENVDYCQTAQIKESQLLNIAYLINTSGTSYSRKSSNQLLNCPKSKYIFVPHQSIVSNIKDFKHEYQFTCDDNIFITSPFTFDPSLCDIFLALSCCSSLFLCSSTIRNSSQNIQRIFRQFSITYCTVTPSLWRRFYSPELVCSSTSSLRFLNFGGEQSIPVEQLKSTILSLNSKIRICNLYGLTEVSAWASILNLNDNLDYLNEISKKYFWKREDSEFYFTSFMPICGRSLRDTKVYLENGEIVIESKTRRCLILNIDNRWTFHSKLFTGDSAHEIHDDSKSFIYYLRRNSETDFVKLNGVKCYLPHIELVIMEQFGSENEERGFQVQQCLVFPGDWHQWKQSVVDLVLKIHHFDHQQKRISLEEIKSDVLCHLSSKLKVQFAFRCHLLDSCRYQSILNSNGKLDYSKVKDQIALSSSPIYRLHNSIENFTKEEFNSKMLSIITSVLNLESTINIEGHIDKQLLHLGMTSMDALQLCLEIEDCFGWSTNDTNNNLFEVILNSSISVILDYVWKQFLELSFKNCDSVEAISKSLVNEEILPILSNVKDHEHSNVFYLGKNAQLNFSNLREIREKVPLSISHQWSVFMDECIDATPLIVVLDNKTYLIAASHSGLVIGIDPFTTSNNLPYQQLWSAHLPNRIESSPTVNFDGKLVYVSDYSGLFCALETVTGRIVWQFKTDDMVKCTAALFNGKGDDKFVICGSYDHQLYCWHQFTGKLKWKVNVNDSAVFASPVLACDYTESEEIRILCATLNGTVACVSLSNGSILWKRSISKRNSPIFSTPLITPISAIIGLTDSSIVALSLSDGMPLWTVQVDGPIFSTPSTFTSAACEQMAIYGTHGCSVICLNINSGKLAWKHMTKSVVYSSAFVWPDSSVVIVMESDGILHVLDALTGRPHSISTKIKDSSKILLSDQCQLPTNQGQVFSSPIYHRGKLFLGSRDSCLHCLSIESL